MTRWQWQGGPLEPTKDLVDALARPANLLWWLEPDLLGHTGCTLVLTLTGSKADPVRVPPGSTLVLDNGRPRVEGPALLLADTLEQSAQLEHDETPAQDDDDATNAAERGCTQFKPEWGFRRRTGGKGYLRFTDINGNQIQVVPSATTGRHCVRIFVEPLPQHVAPRPTRSGLVHPGEQPASVLLCRGMVRELRDALDQMLAEPVADELACEYTITPPDGTTYVVESRQGRTWRARCACGRVLSGGKHAQGPMYADSHGGMSTSLSLVESDPSNREAIEHFAACEAHLNQPSGRCTIVGIL